MSIGPLTYSSHRVGLVRPRLLNALAGLSTDRLALVVAPAGTGKTTLLAQYAAQWDGPVGWWHVEPGNTSAHAVVHGVWQAVGAPSGMPTPADLDSLIAALAEAPPDNRLLILEDLHCLDRTDAEAALEKLILHAPDSLHILAGGRRMPGFNLSRHELSTVTVLNAEHLRFRSWEVEYLLADVYREPLPPDDVATLTRRLNGWAAGVHMFHLSTSGRPLAERRRAITALDGRSTLTRGYLARTVLAELPAQLREFMTRTCVFEVLTPQRCEQLLDGPGDSDRLLAELDQRQALTSTNDGGLSYHYHDVLRAHLAVTLAGELGDTAAREWHARAAKLLVAEGALVEAARAYARAEEWSQVRDLLGELGVRVAEEELEPWRDLLPSWLVADDPWLSYAEARQMLSRGQLAPAIEKLRRAEEHFCDEQGRTQCRVLRQLAAAWLPGGNAPGGNGTSGQHLGQLRAAVRHHPALVASAARHQPLVQSVAHLLAGNIADARRAVLDVAADTIAPDMSMLASLGVRLLHAWFELSDRSPAAHHQLAAVLADAERAHLPWMVRLARAAEALDGSARGVAEARAVVRECDRDADSWGALLAQGIVCLARSLSREADAGDVDDATNMLDRSRQADAPVLAAWAQALLAVASARAALPEADLEIRRADALARSTGVPGVRVAALAAAARAGAQRVNLVALSAQCGLPAAVAARWAGRPAQRIRVIEPLPVEVWCLGGFRMRRFGTELDLSTVKPRTRSALRLLAMHVGRPVHRETLIEALWPDMPFATATRNLHVALSSLRTFLEPGAARGHSELVLRHGEAYELALPAGSYCDVATFRTALANAHRAQLTGDIAERRIALRTAVLAYGGELLPEDGPAEWVVRERDLLQRHAAEASLELATLQLEDGEAAEAVATAERCVQIDRYCDPGWRVLAQACDLLPSPAAAARVRRRYAEMLASLGIDAPADDLTHAVSRG